MRKQIIFAFVRCARIVRRLALRSELAYSLLFVPWLAEFRALLGQWKAWHCFEKARRSCPAYKRFMQEHPAEVSLRHFIVPDFSQITPMDKPNYIKLYTIAQRCHGGIIPMRGAVIDESSGSTGKPNNWVRGPQERKDGARVMQIALKQLVGNKQIFFINAFALGPWATGMCVSNAISDECLLKSTGPDVDKIVTTLKDFGPEFFYVISGYPPFLKMLVDSKEVDWKQYEAIAFYGGEGMSEACRSYLMGAFQAVYGDYGASDLEINVAAESEYTVALRRLMMKNESLRRRLNAPVSNLPERELQDALPHIFQYNPLDYFVESNEHGELLVTLCRAANVAPKIRYNIHDNGYVMTFGQLQKILAQEGMEASQLPKPMANLPVMLHYGRSDLSQSYYGCKIMPSEIEKILYESPVLAPIFSSFRLIPNEDEKHNKTLTLAIELARGAQQPSDVEGLRLAIFAALAVDNQDYRKSAEIAAQGGVTPKLEFYGFREGPFVGSDIRLKAQYTAKK